MVNKSNCQCGFTIKEMDETLFNLERSIKELSDENAEQEWEHLFEKVERIQMAIKSTEKVCDIKFKEAKESAYGLVRLLTERDVLNRITKIDSEIYRELDNCVDRLRMEK